VGEGGEVDCWEDVSWDVHIARDTPYACILINWNGSFVNGISLEMLMTLTERWGSL